MAWSCSSIKTVNLEKNHAISSFWKTCHLISFKNSKFDIQTDAEETEAWNHCILALNKAKILERSHFQANTLTMESNSLFVLSIFEGKKVKLINLFIIKKWAKMLASQQNEWKWWPYQIDTLTWAALYRVRYQRGKQSQRAFHTHIVMILSYRIEPFALRNILLCIYCCCCCCWVAGESRFGVLNLWHRKTGVIGKQQNCYVKYIGINECPEYHEISSSLLLI